MRIYLQDLSEPIQRAAWQRFEDFVEQDLWCMYSEYSEYKQNQDLLVNISLRLLEYLDAHGKHFEEDGENPIVMFLVDAGEPFGCNCSCGTVFVLACLECLGLLPSANLFAAIQSRHIYVGVESDNQDGTFKIVETTRTVSRCSSQPSQFYHPTPLRLYDPQEIAAYVIRRQAAPPHMELLYRTRRTLPPESQSLTNLEWFFGSQRTLPPGLRSVFVEDKYVQTSTFDIVHMLTQPPSRVDTVTVLRMCILWMVLEARRQNADPSITVQNLSPLMDNVQNWKQYARLALQASGDDQQSNINIVDLWVNIKNLEAWYNTGTAR